MERLERVLCGQMSTGWKTISVSSVYVCGSDLFLYSTAGTDASRLSHTSLPSGRFITKKKKARTQMENRCETGFCQTRFQRARAVIFF